MALVRYDPPGYLSDFGRIPGQLDAWSRLVSGWFDENIVAIEQTMGGQPSQLYNAIHGEPAGPLLDQPLVWNAFPGTYRNRFGRAAALPMADRLVPLTTRMDGPGSYFVGPQWDHLYYRPNDEYCEWRVDRDAGGAITSITFTSEPPEYWQALHGDDLPGADGDPPYTFPGDTNLLVELYRELVSPEVQYEDLICQEDLIDLRHPDQPVYKKGAYNPYNRWNTVDGIVHLTQPANSLGAEITLAADATVLRRGADHQLVTDPDALICCASYGGANRCSDPTIGSSVNELAALGAAITLRNPVGLSMNHIDLTGITEPDGTPITEDYFTVVRGQAEGGLIERAVFAVPEGAGFTVSDLLIGGVPVAYGGQIAERITVNLVGRAGGIGTFHNTAIGCDPNGGCCVEGEYLEFAEGSPCRPGMVPAFVETGPVPVAAPTRARRAAAAAAASVDAGATDTAAVATAAPAPSPTAPRRPRHRTRTA